MRILFILTGILSGYAAFLFLDRPYDLRTHNLFFKNEQQAENDLGFGKWQDAAEQFEKAYFQLAPSLLCLGAI